MSRARKIAAVTTLWALRVVAGVLLLLFAAVVALRAAPVRRGVVRIALPLVNRSLAGHIQLASLDGDLTRTIILHDLKIHDAEGVQALYARRIEAHFDLTALWRHTVQIDELDVDGAQVLIRHLADNRVNFAALAPPSASAKAAAAPSAPPRLVVKHLRLRFDGGYDPPRGHEGHPLERPRGSFDIEGSADIRGADVTVRVDHLISDARDPLAAHVELSGGLKVDPPRTADGHTELTFIGVKVTVAADGDQIERINPALRAKGRWQVRVDGGGPLSALVAHVLVAPPTGTLVADGTLARTWPGVRWSVVTAARALQPADDWRGLQAGNVELDLSARGGPEGGAVEVRRFDAATGDLRVRATGISDFTGAGHGDVVASAGDLRRLAAFGVSGLGGSARFSAQLRRTAGRTVTHGELHGSELRLASATVGAVDVRWSSDDWAGKAELAARRLRTAQVTLAAVAVATTSDGRRLHSRIDLRRDDDARAHVELAATERRDAHGPTGADVVIAELVASSKSGRFRLPSPARLHLFGTMQAPSLDGDLAGVTVRIRGRSTPDQFIVDASVDDADLSKLGSPSLAGQLHAAAHAVTGAQLRLDATVHGSGLRLAAVHIHRLDAQLHAVDWAGSAHVTVDRVSAPRLVAESLTLDARSDAEKLTLTLVGRGPSSSTLTLALDGRYLRRGAQPIGADLTLRQLTLAAADQSWSLARPATVRIDSSVTIDRFVLSSAGQTIAIDGSFAPARSAFDITLVARDLEPARLAKLVGVKDALSDTTVNGHAHLSGTMSAPSLQASFEALSDKKVGWYGLAFNRLSVALSARREQLLVHVDGGGGGNARLALDARATPRWSGDTLVAVDATLDRVRLTANEHVWQTEAPCRLRFDRAVTVDDCKLAAGKQEIALAGRVPFDESPMDATIVTRALDLRALGALLAPGHKEPPTTSFAARVHVTGTRKAPLAELELSGHGSQVDEGLPENVDYRVRAHYAAGRVGGEVSARQVGTKLGIGARFDLPISFAQANDEPLRLELEARPVPFFKIRDSLPPAIAGLRGFFTLRVRVSGTTRHPLFNVELHAPSWDLDDLTNNDTIVNLTYDGTLLRANSVTSFAATSFIGSLLRIKPKRNAGTVKLELTAPIDIGRFLSRPRDMLDALVHDTELTGSAELKGVELQRVPLQMIGVATPFTAGLVDGALALHGTLHAPSVHARLRAIGLGKPGVLDHVDVDATFALERKLAQLSGTVDLRTHRLVTFKGEGELDAHKLFDGERWQDGAIRGELELPRWSLVALRGMQPRLARIAGTTWGKGTVRGSFARPEAALELSAADVELGGDRFERAHLEARYRDRRFVVRGDAAQAHGGSLAGEATWSRSADDPFALSLRARGVDIGFLASASEEVRSLGGTLDAELTIGGTLAAPRPEGFLTIARARLGLRGKSEEYRDGALDFRVVGGSARLTIDVASGDGALGVTGIASVDGVQPTRVELTAHARRFALVYGSFAAKLDADFGVVGDRASGQWTGRLDLRRGTIDLPDLASAAEVQPLGELADLTYGDQRAARIVQPKAGSGHWLAARVVGPLHIRGHELNVDLASDLAITIAPGKASAAGSVAGTNGTVDLFGHRYRLEAADVRFDGAIDDPALHLRATRKSGAATLIIAVSGSARHPLVSLASDPPIFDQAQLVGLVLAGATRPSTSAALSFHDANQQIGGVLSNIVLHEIKAQMAVLVPSETFEPVQDNRTARFALSPLEVGRFVSDRIYVSYEHQFGATIGRSAANVNESQIRLRLPHGGELDSTVGDAGVAGVYLYWTYRY